MVLKIKKKLLVQEMGKFGMNGGQQIIECLLKFEKDGMKTITVSAGQLCAVKYSLKPEAFEEYEAIGNVGLDDFSKLISVINSFNEILTIKKEGNKLTVSEGSKKVAIPLVEEEYIKKIDKLPDLEHDEIVEIESDILKNIFKDVQLNKDAIITIETFEKKFKISNSGKYAFSYDVDSEKTKGGVKCSFGQPMVDALSNLTGKLELHMKNDYPTIVKEQLPYTEIEVMVSPWVEDSKE